MLFFLIQKKIEYWVEIRANAKIGKLCFNYKKVNRDAGLMGDSAYRFYSSKALQNWSQMFWEHPGRWCSIYRTPTLPLAANRTAGLSRGR